MGLPFASNTDKLCALPVPAVESVGLGSGDSDQLIVPLGGSDPIGAQVSASMVDAADAVNALNERKIRRLAPSGTCALTLSGCSHRYQLRLGACV